MKLKEWRQRNKLSLRAMGRALKWPGAHPGMSIHHYETGYCVPRKGRAAQIVKFTDGEVTLEELFALPPKSRRDNIK